MWVMTNVVWCPSCERWLRQCGVAAAILDTILSDDGDNEESATEVEDENEDYSEEQFFEYLDPDQKNR